MANSWTAAPGEMSYDDDSDGPRPNCTCLECRNDFYRPASDDGYLCDRCVSAQDFDRELRKLQQRELVDATFVRAVQNFHARAGR